MFLVEISPDITNHRLLIYQAALGTTRHVDDLGTSDYSRYAGPEEGICD